MKEKRGGEGRAAMGVVRQCGLVVGDRARPSSGVAKRRGGREAERSGGIEKESGKESNGERKTMYGVEGVRPGGR